MLRADIAGDIHLCDTQPRWARADTLRTADKPSLGLRGHCPPLVRGLAM